MITTQLRIVQRNARIVVARRRTELRLASVFNTRRYLIFVMLMEFCIGTVVIRLLQYIILTRKKDYVELILTM